MTEWGQGRIEVIALRDEILEQLSCSVPIKRMYRHYVEDGKVSVTYNSFRRQILTYVIEKEETAVQLKTVEGHSKRLLSLKAQSSRNSCFKGLQFS